MSIILLCSLFLYFKTYLFKHSICEIHNWAQFWWSLELWRLLHIFMSWISHKAYTACAEWSSAHVRLRIKETVMHRKDSTRSFLHENTLNITVPKLVRNIPRNTLLCLTQAERDIQWNHQTICSKQMKGMDGFMKQLLNTIGSVCSFWLNKVPHLLFSGSWKSLTSSPISCILSISTGLWAGRICWAKQPFIQFCSQNYRSFTWWATPMALLADSKIFLEYISPPSCFFQGPSHSDYIGWNETLVEKI